MQFSIKTLLIAQAVVAVLLYLDWMLILLALCLAILPFAFLLSIPIWATVRVATRQRRNSLAFYRSQRNKP